MEFSETMSYLTENVLVPLILVIGSAVILILKSYVSRIQKSITTKNDAETLEKIISVRSHILEELSSTVKAAVASNMGIAEEMKKNGNKLTDEQIDELNEKARTLICNALNPSMNEEDGKLLEIIGGKETLDGIITNLIERYVYEYKNKN